MSLQAYQAHGLCTTSPAKGSHPSSSSKVEDPEEEMHFKHSGFQDVTVVETLTPRGPREEIGPTSAFLPLNPKTNKRALRKFDRYSVIIRRVFQRFPDVDVLLRTELCIQSPILCEIFRSIVVDTHTSINITTTPIVMPAPFYELFFRRKEIEQYIKDHQNEEDTAEVRLLHDFFRNDRLTIDNMAEYERMTAQGTVDVGTLWTLYPPNELLFFNLEEAPECWLCRDVQRDRRDPTLWWVTGARLGFNGRTLGLTSRRCPISFAGKVDGKLEISELPLVPKRYVARVGQIMASLLKRGQMFRDIMNADLNGHAYRHYNGTIWADDAVQDSSIGVSNERIVADYRAFLASNPHAASRLESLRQGSRSQSPDSDSDIISSSSSSDSDDTSLPAPPKANSRRNHDGEKDAFIALLKNIPKRFGINTMEDLLLLSPARIPAFGLRSKQWYWILIDNLTLILANDVPFSSLQVDSATKTLLRSLVAGHHNGAMDTDFDDVVMTKGRGLVVLLHGKPGIGKTLTAESIAELFGSPLYSVAGGELGVNIGNVERKLKSVFEIGKRWRAIVLLDEADVVMAKRSALELERNAIVAVWLRMLEYFEGILFLTSNRNDQFDEALQSRIHLTVKLPELGQMERQRIWEALVRRNTQLIDEGTWTPEAFEILGRLEVNGRRIKNLLRTAAFHARSSKGDNLLSLKYLSDVIKVELSSHKNVKDVLLDLERLIPT